MTRFFTKGRLLYAILSPAAGQVKFGTSSIPAERMEELQWAHGHPLELLAQVKASRADERRLHNRLAMHRLHGEWFRACPEVMAVVEELKALQAEQEGAPYRSPTVALFAAQHDSRSPSEAGV